MPEIAESLPEGNAADGRVNEEILRERIQAIHTARLEAYLAVLYGVIRSPIEHDEERARTLRKAWEAENAWGR